MMSKNELLESFIKMSRLHAFINSVNRLILRSENRNKLYAEICRIAVEEGPFTMSWFGSLDPESGLIKPESWAGSEDGHFNSEDQEIAGMSMRERRIVVVNDITINPKMAMWRASGIALPIITNKKKSILMIYASEPNFFNKVEVEQLEDLASNISFALESIESKELLKQAEKTICEKNSFSDLIKTYSKDISLIENMREGLMIMDYNYTYLYVNSSMAKLCRTTQEELIGHTSLEKFPGFEITELFIKLKTCMEDRIPQTLESEFVFPDGSSDWFEIHISPVPEGCLVLSLYIGERKKMLAELERASKAQEEEKLYNASKMSALGEMASGMAHEINNPLSIIVLKISQLTRKLDGAKLSNQDLKEGLGIVAMTAQRIGKVIKGLSSISRNAKNDPMKKNMLDMIIEETLQLCMERLNSKSVNLLTDLSAIANVEIECRPSQIMQVLLNLLNNAFDAISTLPDKWISVKAIPTEFGVEISVSDSGNGVPDHLIDKVMQSFFTTKEAGKGIGLGLSISKKIVEEHHGYLYYQKNSPHTCFVVALPYLQNSKAKER